MCLLCFVEFFFFFFFFWHLILISPNFVTSTSEIFLKKVFQSINKSIAAQIELGRDKDRAGWEVIENLQLFSYQSTIFFCPIFLCPIFPYLVYKNIRGFTHATSFHPGKMSIARYDCLCFQFSLVAQLCLTLCNPMDCSTPGFLSITNSCNLLKLMSIESVMPPNHLILCCPLLLPPSIFPSIRVFSDESVLHIRQPKYWNFSVSISPSNEYSELISFRMDWLDLLAVQVSLKSLLQHHSSKA